MKSIVEWILSKLFPIHGVEMRIAPADKFIPSSVLIQILKDCEEYSWINKNC